jgi:hypothetical protein
VLAKLPAMFSYVTQTQDDTRKPRMDVSELSCGGRFRLGIGVGWNEIKFIALNENFQNRGRRSQEAEGL